MKKETRDRVLIVVVLAGCLAWFVAAAVMFGRAHEHERQVDGSADR